IRAPLDTEHARQLWYLGIAAALGALGGACVLFAYKVGVALVGALGGFALATWILAMQTNGVIHSDVGRALFIAALVVAGIVAALFIQRPAVIVASAVWGSYVLFVGIDCFARTGFQYTALAFLSTPGAVYETTPKVYAMIACMALSALLGIFAQFRLTRKPKASDLELDFAESGDEPQLAVRAEFGFALADFAAASKSEKSNASFCLTVAAARCMRACCESAGSDGLVIG
ncbi:hypothetical protein GGH97_006252, partial [Coemansia sp. RSA 475]